MKIGTKLVAIVLVLIASVLVAGIVGTDNPGAAAASEQILTSIPKEVIALDWDNESDSDNDNGLPVLGTVITPVKNVTNEIVFPERNQVSWTGYWYYEETRNNTLFTDRENVNNFNLSDWTVSGHSFGDSVFDTPSTNNKIAENNPVGNPDIETEPVISQTIVTGRDKASEIEVLRDFKTCNRGGVIGLVANKVFQDTESMESPTNGLNQDTKPLTGTTGRDFDSIMSTVR